MSKLPENSDSTYVTLQCLRIYNPVGADDHLGRHLEYIKDIFLIPIGYRYKINQRLFDVKHIIIIIIIINFVIISSSITIIFYYY